VLQLDWTESAELDLAEILGYVSDRNPQAAERLYAGIDKSLEIACEHPFLYKRSDRIPMAREIVIQANYIVLYLAGERIEVIAVVHARQNYPNSDF
jgi:plasmid stabilization system protein ParE